MINGALLARTLGSELRVDPDLLRAFDVTLEQAGQALAESNQSDRRVLRARRPGVVDPRGRRVASAAELEQTVIAVRDRDEPSSRSWDISLREA